MAPGAVRPTDHRLRGRAPHGPPPQGPPLQGPPPLHGPRRPPRVIVRNAKVNTNTSTIRPMAPPPPPKRNRPPPEPPKPPLPPLLPLPPPPPSNSSPPPALARSTCITAVKLAAPRSSRLSTSTLGRRHRGRAAGAAEAAGASDAVMGVPHEAQKRCPGAASVPHDGQFTGWGRAPGRTERRNGRWPRCQPRTHRSGRREAARPNHRTSRTCSRPAAPPGSSCT